MATTTRPIYGAPALIACTTTALASDDNLVAGRQSAIISNVAVQAVTAMLGGTIVTTGTPAAGSQIEVWLFGSWDGGTLFTAGASRVDGDLSLAGWKKGLMVMAQTIAQQDAVARTYEFGPIDVAAKFGGNMPNYWGVFIVHNTGAILGATDLRYTPVNYQHGS